MFCRLFTSGVTPRLEQVVNKITAPQVQHVRTTFILKRRNPALLARLGRQPRKLKSRHFVYDLVEDTVCKKKEDMKVILTASVEGYGHRGDVVEIRPFYARCHLLLPKLAVYATPENLEKFAKEIGDSGEKKKQSSLSAAKLIQHLSTEVVPVLMNMEMPWTIEPWHIRVAFRRAGFHMPTEAITMPTNPINGPDLSLEGKEFYVTVMVNKLDSVHVRCRLYHGSAGGSNQMSFNPDDLHQPCDPIFPDEKDFLASLPRRVLPKQPQELGKSK